MKQPKDIETKQEKFNVIAAYVFVALAAFAVYYNSLSNEFVFDDDSVVLGDQTITSLSNIPKYFTGELGFHKVIGRYYRPIVSATYAVDHALWGLKPFGFHLTNILIHVLNCVLLFALLRLIFEGSVSKFKDYAILIGTLVFAVHPIHTEAVAWVSGRTDSLSCTFFFAAFIYYLKYSKPVESKLSNLVLGLLFYLLALLSKEMAITLPAVIILYDLVINRMSIKQVLSEKSKVYASFILLSVLYLVLRWAVLKDVPQRESYFYFYGKDFATALFTMLQTLPFYFKLAVFPVGMLYHYSGYLPYVNSIAEPTVIFAAAFVIIIGFTVYYLYKRFPMVSFSLIFFFLTLLPVLNIVPTMNFMGDRFLYLPSVFLSLVLIAIIIKYYFKKNSGMIITLSTALLLVFGFMTVSRNADWKTNDELFMSADGKPGSVVYVNIGNIYANKGDYKTAEKYYRQAIDLNVPSVLSYNNLGKLFLINNNYDSAYFYIHKAYLLDTLSPEPMHTMATLFARFDRLPEAIYWLEKVQTVSPKYMNSDQMLNELTLRQQSNPVNPDPRMLLDPGTLSKIAELERSSFAHYSDKKYDESISDLAELIELNPSGAKGYYNNMGMCYYEKAMIDDAIKCFNESIKVDPMFSTGYNNLGQAFEKKGDKNKAIDYYQKALEKDPNNKSAKENLNRIK
jgi:protein O-mannosyl-transferase